MAMRKIKIEVAFATPAKQLIIPIEIKENCTIAEAIHQSTIQEQFPEIDLTKQKVGIFSKQKNLADIVQDGDRIEIYRPLTIDPKEARRAKVKGQKR